MPARLIARLLRSMLAPMVVLLALIAPVPANAVTITLGPSALQLSPSGPYSSARNAAVGTVIATATSTINVTGLSGTCSLTAVFLSLSPANGNTYTTGLTGLGINLYYAIGGTKTQINPGIGLNLPITPAAPGPVTIEADLIVTGAVSSGSLTDMPNVTVTFAALGLGCGILNLTSQTLFVTATSPTVTALGCTVSTPALTVTLPTVSVQTLAAFGQTGGATNFSLLLNCTGTGTGIYITLTDASAVSNTSALLSLTPLSTATNVKLQILDSTGAAVSYGPDAASIGALNQWFVGSSSAVSSIPLTVRYYATGAATAGTVLALATFTLSYQ